jgi:predicted small metal-binding protein
MGLFGTKKEAAATMPKKEMWVVECGPECRFRVQDHNKAEAVQIAILHNKTSHKTTLKESEVLPGLKSMML